MAKHIVKQGECMDSIAYKYGFFWETLWNLPENAELKQERKNPNVLFTGDEVLIPDKLERAESASTEKKHRFRRKGVPAKFRMRFIVEGEPLTDEAYRLVIDGGAILTGQLDSDGLLDVPLPPDAKEATVLIGQGEELLEYRFDLGRIDPIDTLSGIQARLNNLGFQCEKEPTLGESTRNAIERFQASQGSLSITGEPDRATCDALVADYGS